MEIIAKSKLIAVILVLYVIEGAILIIYGFSKGANILAIISVFIDTNYPISINETYVVVGIGRILGARMGKTSANNRTETIIVGIFFVVSSFGGVAFSIGSSGISDSAVYGIVIEFIVTFSLSLLYLIYAFKQVEN